MHNYAKGAMVGCGFHRVKVCDLNDGKQRKQDQAHHSHHRQSTMLCPSFAAEICQWSGQYTFPYLKDTLCWMFESGKGYVPAVAFFGLLSHPRLIPNV
jgi:hypothetical protein